MRRLRAYLSALLALTVAAANAHAVEIVAGPMVGHVTSKSARVWMQFSLAGEVSITAYDIAGGQPVSGVKIGLEGPLPFICDVPLNNLQPDSSYRIDVKFDGQPLKLPGPELVIRTAPVPGDQAIFSIAFGSNLGIAPMPPQPKAAAPAPPQKNALPIFKSITALKPRAFLFLGNTGYLPARLEDFPVTKRAATTFLNEFHSRIRQTPDLQELLRATPTYAIYNDRDFGTLHAGRSFVFADESILAFQRFWPNPDWGTPENPGCYSSFTLGDVDFFLLDARTYRDDAKKILFGDAQLDWLKKGLKASKANFKILAAPALLFGDDPARPDPDSWSRFPAEQRPFLAWLAANTVNGIVSLAGGQPAGQLTKVDPGPQNPLKYALYTIATSDLATPPGSAAPAAPPAAANPNRIGNAVPQNNFGTLDFSGTGQHRIVTLHLRDATGKLLLEQLLFAGQLHN